MNENIVTLIKKYQTLYLDILDTRIEEGLLALEGSISQTILVPNDFFDKNSISCDRELKYRDFGETFIIFNDLKGSTEILRKCENLNKICLYTGYIFYSSKLLAEILDLLGGKIVEITGDGNYSIIQKKDFNNEKYENMINKLRTFDIDEKELEKYENLVTYYDDETNQKSNKLGLFIYYIFAIFNIGINKKLKSLYPDIKFATRVGCKFGNCKITRFEIAGHIRLDKLIGIIVNEAAHQATGK
jgi:hypothetical protein